MRRYLWRCLDRDEGGLQRQSFLLCTRIHLWTRFALRLCVNATLAIEMSGCAHSAMT